MTYVQRTLDRFGGLKVVQNLEDVGFENALDGRDFELGEGGAVRGRNGFIQRMNLAFQARVIADMRDPTSGTQRLVIAGGDSNQLAHVVVTDTVGGGHVTTMTAALLPAVGTASDVFTFGTPSTTRGYMLFETGQVRQFDAATRAWSLPDTTRVAAVDLAETNQVAGAPSASTGAEWASQTRVAYAGFTGAAQGPGGAVSSPDHIWFSEPGRPMAFRSDGFVVLSPGDGEKITCVKAWRDYLMVFKETKFFVFVAVQTNAGSVPKFCYRAVDNGVGCVGPRAAVTGEAGMFVVGKRGAYLTQGQSVTSISDAIEGLWTGKFDATQFGGPAIPLDSAFGKLTQVAIVGDVLVLGVENGSTRVLYVYDVKQGEWCMWRPYQGRRQNGALGTFSLLGRRVLVIGAAADYVGGVFGIGTQPIIAALDPGRNSDEGCFVSDGVRATLGSVYRTGYGDLAQDAVARVRQVEVWGQRVQTVALRMDYATVDAASGVGPGASGGPQVGKSFMRLAVVGHRLGLLLAGPTTYVDDRDMAVSRAVLHVSNKRVPSAL